MKRPTTYIMIFETVCNGQRARTEVDCGTANPLLSRMARVDAAAIARVSFKKLMPEFTDSHAIKPIHIEKIIPNPETAGN